MNPLKIGVDSSGKQFALPLELVTQTVVTLARKGRGKSYFAAVVAEEMLDAGQIPLIIDPTGAHWGLKASADGKSPGYSIVVFGGEHADVPLEPTAGEIVARTLVENRVPAILDLSLMRKNETLRFLTAFLETLYRLNREPLHLICDEADAYCPQKPFAEEARTLGAMQDIVRRGRLRGIGCNLVTQRPQVLNKDVLTQASLLVALGMNHPRDLNAIEEWVAVHGDPVKAKAMIQSLPALERGTAWFWAPDFGDLFEKVTIRQRRTFNSGATPKPGERIVAPRQLAKIDVAKLGQQIAETVERAKENDPTELKTQIAKLKKELADRVAVTERVEVPVLGKEDRELLEHLRHVGVTVMHTIEALGKRVDVVLEASINKLKPSHSKYVAAGIVDGIKRTAHERVTVPASATHVPRATGPGIDLPKGERAVLIACAQYPDGVSRSQLTVLTGYKRSSRDTYIQRLRERGFAMANGEMLEASPAGLSALGNSFQPLPTGDALRAHWMAKLPEGERKVLEVLCDEHPSEVQRETIDGRTGYQRSSRDTYLQRLSAKNLIVSAGRGSVRASDELFS